MRTKQTSKRIRTVRRHRLALALVGAMAMPMAPVLAQNLPESGSVVNGSATITPGGSTLTINQTTQGAIIDWGSFSIGSGYGVTFNQPNASSVTLNRVVGFGYGLTPTNIAGSLSANGSVFLINPSGITFGNGAAVNVGGLVASTLWMNSGDFINGMSTGQFVFNGFNGDTSNSHNVSNSGNITAGARGVGFIGPFVQNNGTIITNGGNVGFAAGSAVTMTWDPVGDGLTQVVVNTFATGATASNYGDITADGGQILMRASTGGLSGGVINGGNLRARTLSTSAGRVELTSTGGGVLLGDLRDGYLGPGTIDVTGGAGMQGGSVFLSGLSVQLWSDLSSPTGDPPSWIDASGDAGGGSVVINSLTTRLFQGTSIRADSLGAGSGGSVQLTGFLSIAADQNTLVSASSADGAGGQVVLNTAGGLTAYGSLEARGATAGGTINTTIGGEFDFRGLQVDAGSSSGAPGTWTLSAPNINVISGSDVGTIYENRVTGTSLQGQEINGVLNSGTNLTLRAGVAASDGGDINFADGVDIFYDDGTVPLLLRADAQGSITGSNFSIATNAAPLSMAFNADANNLNNGFGYIDFSGATLDSNGGDIQFYGQSDTANGVASSYATGIRLSNSSITSAGGNVLIRGASTGGDAGSDDAGVVLEFTPIDAGTGNVAIHGSGDGVTSGAVLRFSGITAGSVSIDGQSTNADGILGDGSEINATGDVSLVGTGGARGVAFFGGLYSNGGNIVVDGTGVAGDGIQAIGPIDSAGGDITLRGRSQQAKGLLFGGGSNSGIVSAGGDILLTGEGATAGVELQQSASGPILLFAPGDVDTVNSAGGALTVTGTASGAGAIGVYANGVDLIGGAGDVTVDGSAPLGVGILFANGAGVSTTTGAITLIGEGANFGLDIADGAFDTDSGDITLIGDALATTATAGVRVTAGGLSTNGGDITVAGTSAGGYGVQLGTGGAFAIGSGGGAIDISGSGVNLGVWMWNNQVDSAGGDIDIRGSASGNGAGVLLSAASLNGGVGDVGVTGIAPNGIGLRFEGGSSIVTTSGGIALAGIGGAQGVGMSGGGLTTDSGHVDVRGRGGNGLVIGGGVGIATNGGGIELSGEGVSGPGLLLQPTSSVDAGNSLIVLRAGNDGSSDAIRIGGSIASDLAVNLRPGGVDANGGLTERTADEILVGGGTVGFALGGAELALIDTPQLILGSNLHAGAIRVLGDTSRNGNLTLQNDGGSGGIDLQAAIDVGNGTLALSSGGDITQSAAGAITAHSLLARAGGDVLLANANNNVAANTLAGSSGGDFQYQDVDALAIGSVSAAGMDASSNGMSSIAATGISAGGDVFVRNLAGDMTLNAGVSGVNIDLVTANTLQNLAGASLVASGDWRVWANTWVGETRGGLAGDGNLPNLYGCAYLGQCGVTVPSADNHFIYVQQPTALIAFDNHSREYGLPNPVLTFTVSGAILGDSAANVATGVGTTTATIGSNVGNYPITGNFTSAAGYRIQFVPGTLAITPATLLFTADQFVRYLGTENPLFTGEISGFRNGDTVQSVFGTGVVWSSPAGLLSPIGFYPINGGTSATNYVFAQAPGNATALQIIPLPQLSSTPIDLIRETVNTYVYDRNFGGAPMCALNASLEDQQLASTGDELSNEWSKVRSRPNLTNCFDTERRNSCGDF